MSFLCNIFFRNLVKMESEAKTNVDLDTETVTLKEPYNECKLCGKRIKDIKRFGTHVKR